MIAAMILQLLVLWFTLIGGLNWSGWPHRVAVGQALVGLLMVVWVGRRRPVAALAVPIVSLILTEGIRAVENWVTHTYG